MYKNEFDKSFQSGKIFSGYMFWGQSDYLVETYSHKVALQVANGADITKIYFDDYNFDSCYDILTQSSLFSSSNVLLIKTLKKLPKKDIDKLLNAANTNPDSTVIFACIGDVDFKTMAKSFSAKTSSVEVRFFQPYDNEAISILYEYAQSLNTQIDHHSLGFLYNIHQKDLALCISDITKLAILNQPITAKTINQHCFGLGNVNIEEFLVDLFSKNDIEHTVYLLLEEGINEIYLLGRITTFAQTLFMINSYVKLYGNLNIKEIWGYPLPPKIAQQQASIAQRFTQNDYFNMMQFLQTLELELKSGKQLDNKAYLQAKLKIFLK